MYPAAIIVADPTDEGGVEELHHLGVEPGCGLELAFRARSKRGRYQLSVTVRRVEFALADLLDRCPTRRREHQFLSEQLPCLDRAHTMREVQDTSDLWAERVRVGGGCVGVVALFGCTAFRLESVRGERIANVDATCLVGDIEDKDTAVPSETASATFSVSDSETTGFFAEVDHSGTYSCEWTYTISNGKTWSEGTEGSMIEMHNLHPIYDSDKTEYSIT